MSDGYEEFWRRLEGCEAEHVYLATVELGLIGQEFDEVMDAFVANHMKRLELASVLGFDGDAMSAGVLAELDALDKL